MHYKFCPECGEKLTGRPAGDDGLVPYCDKCEKYWFDSFASCVIILIYNEFNEVVLLKQLYLSDKYLTFTSGFMTPGESAEETAIREAKEEIGIDIKELEYAGTYWFAKREQLMHGFMAYVPKCEFKLSSEVDEASWVPADEVGDKIFPEAPGNAAYAIYKRFLQEKGIQKE